MYFVIASIGKAIQNGASLKIGAGLLHFVRNDGYFLSGSQISLILLVSNDHTLPNSDSHNYHYLSTEVGLPGGTKSMLSGLRKNAKFTES